MKRRHLLAAGSALGAARLFPAFAADTPGVTAAEIKIGNTDAYSGPASAYGVIAKAETAFWNRVNAQGGVAGRKINFISLDDGYSPAKTVEQVRRLVEQDQVAFLFNTLGTAPNTAIQKYLNQKKVPQLFIATGADKWGDHEHFPWTMGFQPSYRTEARIYTKYMMRENPAAKPGILYQNDDFGKDYTAGVKDVLGALYDKVVTASYETTDATMESQVTALRSAGCDTLLVAATPKFAAQAIRTVHDIGWKPMFFLSNVSVSVGSVINPAGSGNATGIISTNYIKDPGDPRWANDPGIAQWRDFMTREMPGADQSDLAYVYAYAASLTMLQVLKQCGEDFSRENVMKQAANLKDLELPVLLPGIRVNTGAANFHPIRAMRLMRWDGTSWVLFGDVISGV